jgi:hypothetical protein
MTKFIIPYAYSIKANDSNMTCWNWAVMMVLLQKTSQAIVILNNFQTFRHFMKPGWTIGPTKLVPPTGFLLLMVREEQRPWVSPFFLPESTYTLIHCTI